MVNKNVAVQVNKSTVGIYLELLIHGAHRVVICYASQC